MRERLLVANCSAFFGDRFSAAREMVEGGDIDVLTGDYLAELTMFILWKNKVRDPNAGYATTFLRQVEEVLGSCLDRGIKIVANAGGLNPAGLARALDDLSAAAGLRPAIAYVTGDDLLDRLPALQASGNAFTHLDTGAPLSDITSLPVTANAYFGGWGIATALRSGADIVVTPRVTDAALVVGPAAWAFDWAHDDWDRLAGAVVAGHVIECGVQATGGNFSFSHEIPDMRHPGFPIAELHRDGSSVITKHSGTGGAVTVETVTSQLLYEIDGPLYANPDVVVDLRSVSLDQAGPDRVLISGARGYPAPDMTKVCLNYVGGYRQSVTFMITGLDVDQKAQLAIDGFFEQLGGREQFDEVDIQLLKSEGTDPVFNLDALSRLVVTLKHSDPSLLGRRVFDAAVSLACANYAGFFIEGDGHRRASAYGVYWPALIPAVDAVQSVVLPDGSSVVAPVPPRAPYPTVDDAERPTENRWADEATIRVPIGALFGARSGDKGGNANVGLFARSDRAWDWLVHTIDEAAFRRLLPEAAEFEISRTELPLIRSVNFVVRGLLGEGVASSVRIDAQAKGLGEFIRARWVDIPKSLVLTDRAEVVA
ncbi:acyclic terpene utilization AtuA family protein [Nocardia sp. NPDC004711]